MAKEPDQGGNDVDAPAESRMEDEALRAHDVVKADGREPKADAAGQKAL